MAKTPGLELVTGIDPVNAVSVDSRWGPYATVAAANLAVTATRYEGLTVGIGTASITEYWWFGGVADANLVPKASGGGGGDPTPTPVDPVLHLLTGGEYIYDPDYEGVDLFHYVLLATTWEAADGSDKSLPETPFAVAPAAAGMFRLDVPCLSPASTGALVIVSGAESDTVLEYPPIPAGYIALQSIRVTETESEPYPYNIPSKGRDGATGEIRPFSEVFANLDNLEELNGTTVDEKFEIDFAEFQDTDTVSVEEGVDPDTGERKIQFTAAPAGLGGHIIQDDGFDMPAEAKFNIKVSNSGFYNLTDNPTDGSTDFELNTVPSANGYVRTQVLAPESGTGRYSWRDATYSYATTGDRNSFLAGNPTEKWKGMLAYVQTPIDDIQTVASGAPWQVAYSPDGQYLVAANTVGSSVTIINSQTYEKTNVAVGSNPQWGIKYNHAGTKIAVANTGSNSVTIISITTVGLVQTYSTNTVSVGSGPKTVDWSPDDAKIAVGSQADHSLSIITVAGLTVSTVTAVGAVQELEYSPDGTRLAFATSDGTGVGIMNTTTQAVTFYATDAGYGTCHWRPNGTQLTVSTNNLVRVFAYPAMTYTAVSLGSFNGINDLAYSPDGVYIALSNGSAAPNGRILLVNSTTLAVTPYVNGGFSFNVAWSADSKYVATSEYGGTVTEVRVSDGNIINYSVAVSSNQLAYNPANSLQLAVASIFGSSVQFLYRHGITYRLGNDLTTWTIFDPIFDAENAEDTATPGASALTIKDEGTNLSTAATSINFVGAGVTATNTGAAVTVTISGTGASIDSIPTDGSSNAVQSNGVFDALALKADSSSAVTLTGTQTLTNKTLTSPVINSGNLGASSTATTQTAADNSTKLATTAYVDSAVSAFSGNSVRETITQTAHGLTAGKVVRYNGTAWVSAQADSSNNAEVLGLVESATTNTFIIVYGGKITLSSLTAGSNYFLSSGSAGAYTVTEPTTSGTVSKPVFFAISATLAIVQIQRGILN